ncbi:hypothetical protein MKW94_021960, partial [Papaver nudicaule]|nr:hypothetical protein [Papaver nudicaule]
YYELMHWNVSVVYCNICVTTYNIPSFCFSVNRENSEKNATKDNRDFSFRTDQVCSVARYLIFFYTLDEYSVQTRSVFEIIIKAMANSLGLEENAFTNQLGDRQIVYTTFNFYPPCPRPDLVYGLKPHTDGGAITILLPDPEVRGLQVHKDDQWVSVPCMPGALLVNIGDTLQVMSNGIFKSPLHRAVTNTERTRVSLGMFYFPHTDEEIEPVAALIDDSNPRKYRKVKVKDFLEIYYKNYSQGKPGYDWASV